MASRFGEGDDMCGAWTPYAWINFPDQAGFWRILSRGIFKGMKLFFFFKRKCQYKYEIETFLLRSSSIITIVIFMYKFYNFIIFRTTITFNNISTIHKNIFILSNRTYFFFLSSCKIKLFEIGFSAKLREFRKIFSPDVKIRYPRFHNLPQKRYRIFFPGRKVEHWGWGMGKGRFLSANILHEYFRCGNTQKCARFRVNDYRIFHIVHRPFLCLRVASYIPRGQFFSRGSPLLPSPEESLRPVRSMEHRFTAYKGR